MTKFQTEGFFFKYIYQILWTTIHFVYIDRNYTKQEVLLWWNFYTKMDKRGLFKHFVKEKQNIICVSNKTDYFWTKIKILINTYLSSIHYRKCSSTYSNKELKVHAYFFWVFKYTTLLQPFSLGHIHIYEKKYQMYQHTYNQKWAIQWDINFNLEISLRLQ